METPDAAAETPTLADLGWRAFFLDQLAPEEVTSLRPVRVLAVHRRSLHVAGEGIETEIVPFSGSTGDGSGQATVGDWLLIEPEGHHAVRLLDRQSVFRRRAPGEAHRTQLIAANIDTLFITTSCNNDFNLARLERYLALACEAEVTPVIVLTKADQTDTPEAFLNQASGLMPDLKVEILDGRDSAQATRLLPWCGHGQTVAFVGSSGVGKSTLVNTLLADDRIDTQAVRESDARGRHTTTHREMHRLRFGGWLLDTPGMRELQLADVHAGIGGVFADLVALVPGCRFRDCKHDTEPGCAINAAIKAGTIDADRVERWKKLLAEDAYNSASVAKRHASGRLLVKPVRNASGAKRP